MYVIGLTGGIGSGKSTVAQMLQRKGAKLLSADAVGHEVYAPGRPAWQEIVEAALLFDAGWDDLTDEVWVTVAPPEVAAARTAERSGISVEEALSRIRAQMSNEERISRSQVVIDTDCALERTEEQVSEEWERLQERLETPSARSGV